MITGTALNYLEALNDKKGHDDRYERLREYSIIIRRLLESTSPVTFHGQFYQVKNLVLLPGIPKILFPEFLVSGQSDSARRLCRDLEGIGLQMLQPTFAAGLEERRAQSISELLLAKLTRRHGTPLTHCFRRTKTDRRSWITRCRIRIRFGNGA